jgi:hypothetical protein
MRKFLAAKRECTPLSGGNFLSSIFFKTISLQNQLLTNMKDEPATKKPQRLLTAAAATANNGGKNFFS